MREELMFVFVGLFVLTFAIFVPFIEGKDVNEVGVNEAVNPVSACSMMNISCGICGDANGDGSVNVGDAIAINNYIFNNGTLGCLDYSDVNGDCSVNVGDVSYLIAYVFKGGPAPNCNCTNSTGNFTNY